MRREPRTLARTLTAQLVLVSTLVSAALLAFFFTKYLLDKPALRRGTLAVESALIVEALRDGQDLSRLALYRDYPNAYGFRVYEQRPGEPLRLVAEANPRLLPRTDKPEPNAAMATPPVPAVELEQMDDSPGADRWQLTEHVKVAKRWYWVQVVMEGDPAWRWHGAILEEMTDHVVLPVLFIVPPITFAIALATQRRLRPLQRIGLQAEALSAAVRTGGRLTPLEPENLPLEFRRLVSALNAMLSALETSLQQQRQFTSDVAHELRTPLSVLLLQIAELPPGPAVERLRAEIEDLAAMVHQLLRLAQAEDMMQRAPERVDLVAVVRSVCEDIAGPALARRVTLQLVCEAARLELSGNAALLDIAIRNLVDNAVKWSAPDTDVTITVDALGSVVVEDRGPGVPDVDKERIFERFWRVEGQRAGGIGVGLALVRRIARLHSGDVRVVDREGGGTRFILALADDPQRRANRPKLGPV